VEILQVASVLLDITHGTSRHVNRDCEQGQLRRFLCQGSEAAVVIV